MCVLVVFILLVLFTYLFCSLFYDLRENMKFGRWGAYEDLWGVGEEKLYDQNILY